MTDATTGKLNATDGHLLAGVEISANAFLARAKATQLFQITRDPRDAEDKKKVAASKDLQDLQEIREDVQRLFEGQKKKNVQSYADYIEEVYDGQDGMTPPIILYSEEVLPSEVAAQGLGYIQVPYGQMLVAIDGETQLAARFEAANRQPETSREFVAVYVVHGRDKGWARQSFHDLNVLGVRPNAALSIGMDARDPLTQVARDVERLVPFFKDRVNKVRRQLRASDIDVTTIASLRGACITFTEGIAGVKYGAKPVAVSDDRLPQIRSIGVEWFVAVTDALGAAMQDRENKLAAAPSVMAAIGAMGHDLLNIEDAAQRSAKLNVLINRLRQVDWRRGKHWEGIAGKFTPKGAFSVGGSKETAYAVFEALNDETSAAFARVRPGPSASAA